MSARSRSPWRAAPHVTTPTNLRRYAEMYGIKPMTSTEARTARLAAELKQAAAAVNPMRRRLLDAREAADVANTLTNLVVAECLSGIDRHIPDCIGSSSPLGEPIAGRLDELLRGAITQHLAWMNQRILDEDDNA